MLKLYKHQSEGVEFITANRKSILAFDMGLGKTLTSLVALCSLIKTKQVRQALIVVPAFLLKNWQDEIDQWVGLSYHVYHGPKRKLIQARIILTTYETITKDREKLEAFLVGDYMLICDEAHYIKNKESKRSQAIHALNPMWLVLLTGTPISNRLEDFYSLLYRVAPDVAGEYSGFAVRFLNIITKTLTVKNRWGYLVDIQQPKVVGYRNLDHFYTMCQPYMMRRTKEACLDLPDKRVIQLSYEPTATRTQYANVQATAESTSADFRGVSPTIVKLRQLLSGKAEDGFIKTDKFQVLCELLEQTDSKVIVWFAYKETQKLVYEALSKLDMQVFAANGDQAVNTRLGVVNEWKQHPGQAILLATIQALGTGLNLTESDTAIFYEFDYSPALNVQAEDRIYRIGQPNKVVIYYLYGIGTVEEGILNLLKQKKDVNKAGYEKLTPEDIKRINTYTFSTGVGIYDKSY